MYQVIKSHLLFLLFSLFSLSMHAQTQKPEFNPQKFDADLEQYVARKGGLTPSEASKFFPLYRQMRTKMRINFSKERENFCINENDEKACEHAIRSHDANELNQKKIQQEYHARFLKILPATKVFKIIRAEEEFHRHAFKRAARRNARAGNREHQK